MSLRVAILGCELCIVNIELIFRHYCADKCLANDRVLMINEVTVNELDSFPPRTDRRKNSAKSLMYSFFKRRRRHLRRGKDANIYVDIHEPHIFIICALTILLSATDATFTLYIVENGGEEVNPFMRYFLEMDVALFFWVKYCLTTLGMIFLITHKNFTFFNLIRGYHVLYSAFVMYFSLIMYELYLISQIQA